MQNFNQIQGGKYEKIGGERGGHVSYQKQELVVQNLIF